MNAVQAAKIVGGLAVAVIIGTAMARGIHHPGPAPAAHTAPAAATRAAPGGFLGSATFYRVLALAVVTLAAYWIIRRYYKLQHRRLQIEVATVDGWAQVRHAELRELWRCPSCGGLVELVDVDQHQERSVCAAYERWVAATGGEEGQPIRANAPPWSASVTATLPPDQAVNTGGYDDLMTANAGEIEE